jgi:hypothetical protein
MSVSYDERPLHGVYGGLSTDGHIAMAIYSERPTLPTSAVVRLTPSDAPGVFDGKEDVEVADGLHRTIHATYFLDIGMAKSVIEWLQDKVDTYETQRGGIK